MTSSFWQDRRTFITGAFGLVGSSTVEQLIQRGADVVALRRDIVPQSDVALSDAIRKITVVDGDITDQLLMERILGEYEIKTVLHLAAQAIVGVGNRNPVSTFDSNIRGTWSVLEALEVL